MFKLLWQSDYVYSFRLPLYCQMTFSSFRWFTINTDNFRLFSLNSSNSLILWWLLIRSIDSPRTDWRLCITDESLNTQMPILYLDNFLEYRQLPFGWYDKNIDPRFTLVRLFPVQMTPVQSYSAVLIIEREGEDKAESPKQEGCMEIKSSKLKPYQYNTLHRNK